MKKNRDVIYWIIVSLMICVSCGCFVLGIIYLVKSAFGNDGIYNVIWLIIFGMAFFIVGIMSTVFQIKKLFRWFYKIIAPLAERAKPEWMPNAEGFSFDTPVAYKRLKKITPVLYIISIFFYLMALMIYLF